MEDTLKKKIKSETVGLIVAGLIALVIRTFLFQPFNIPTGSMYPTLMVGDFLFVSKYTYGYSNTAYPFHLKFYEGRVMGKAPTRGEVIVFNNPKRPELDYIKRCIGLPGDKIQIKKGILHINGTPTKLEESGLYTYVNQHGQPEVVKKYKETLPGEGDKPGVTHFILKTYEFGQATYDNTEEFTVPEGNFFAMGDNRDNSGDSRDMKSLGFVPFERIIGRAEILFFSTAAKLYRNPQSPWWALWDLDILAWLPGIRFDRFFNLIR